MDITYNNQDTEMKKTYSRPMVTVQHIVAQTYICETTEIGKGESGGRDDEAEQLVRAQEGNWGDGGLIKANW